MEAWSKFGIFFRFLFLSLIFWLLSYSIFSFPLSFGGEKKSVSQILASDISFEFQRKKEEFTKVILGTTAALTAAIPLSLLDQYVRNLVLSSYDKTKDLGKVMSFLGEGIFLVPFSFAGYVFGLVSHN